MDAFVARAIRAAVESLPPGVGSVGVIRKRRRIYREMRRIKDGQFGETDTRAPSPPDWVQSSPEIGLLRRP
jgi:hypothetical protein